MRHLTPCEAQMLDLIAEAPTPHEWLLSPNFELLFNTDNPHGNSQKTAALRRLHQHGMIDRDSANIWQLTEQGGKMWEKLAQPDWDNFAEYAVEYGSECEYFHVYAATRPLFDRLLRRLPLPPEAWRIEILPCWQLIACYWKTLPQGFHAQAEIGIGQFDGLPLWDELPQWKKSLCRTALRQPEN